MFWGLVLEPSKKYTQKVDQTFHISQAALDLKSCDAEPIQLVVEYENSNFVLATLSKKANIFQVPLDLIFKTGDQVSFRTIGNGKVHLSGYHVLEDLDSMIMNGEEESDVEMEEISKGKVKRKKATPNSKGGKKAKLDDMNELESDEDDDDEEEEDDDDDDFDEEDEDSEDMDEETVTPGKKGEKKKQKMNSSMLSMDYDVDEEEDEDEDEDEDEEDEDDDEDEEEEEDDEEMNFDLIGDDSDETSLNDLNSSKKKKKNKAEGKKAPQTPNGIEPKGKDKSAQKLNKSLKQGTPGKDGKTPKNENKQKNEKNSKPGTPESTPQRKNAEGQKKEEKTPKSPKPEGSPQKKVLEGGVISEEIKVGNGPVAKPGKMANVYYVGCLASTKKEFDSVQSGGGFKFRIGRNEVIKGWDIGINGMKVGGKRKLTIPPHLAYGSKGSPPVIPPNSTLVFTVELKGLS